MAANTSGASESPLTSVETRKFRLEIVTADNAPDRQAGAPRLALFASSDGGTRLRLYASPDEESVARRELVERGYRNARSCACAGSGYGSWRGFLNELDASHIVVETLGWSLTPAEKAALDAVDDYGRGKPSGFHSSRLS